MTIQKLNADKSITEILEGILCIRDSMDESSAYWYFFVHFKSSYKNHQQPDQSYAELCLAFLNRVASV